MKIAMKNRANALRLPRTILRTIQQTPEPSEELSQLIRQSFQTQSLFETYITTTNILHIFGQRFMDRISSIALDFYKNFEATVKDMTPGISRANINNAFFNWIISDPYNNWPELTRSREFPTLFSLLQTI